MLQYGDHLGLPALRELVAADGAGVTPDDVLVTPGAVAALFIIHTTLLEAGSHAIVARPNYATNVETPRTVGADVEYLDLAFEDGWTVDPDRIAAMLRPETRLVSLTTPHNPTGATLSRETLDAVIGLVERHGVARLLVDETYREMTFGDALPVAASLSDRVISVSSLSKTYGLPGIRVGWLVTRDPELLGRFLAAKEQILISGSLVDETIAVRALERRPTWLPEIRDRIAAAFSVTASWIDGNPRFEWVPPRGGVVGFPRIRPEVAAGLDVDRFYDVAVRAPRDDRRAGPLVRAAPHLVPPRLRLADPRRAAWRPRGARRGARRGPRLARPTRYVNSDAYALSAGWPPRCAYRTFDPAAISPRVTRSISPAIDFPS